MTMPVSAADRETHHAALLAQAKKDQQTVNADGSSRTPLIAGVVIRDLVTHIDERGSVCELFDLRWTDYPDPFFYSYFFTIRPGVVKGWNLHAEHEDRYSIIQGELSLVLYDTRPDSPTCGVLNRIILSAQRRQLVNVPKNVWHADHNIGSTDVLVVNHPTMAYRHEDPDKFRLPIDTPLIPYSFGNATGW